jgi:hypothetical protein
MAQQLYPFDTFSVGELNLQLMKKLGYSIKSKSDCAKLSELIFNEGLGLISQSTLYRILLYDKAHKPFYNTLSIITQFLGYIDWEDFCKTIHRKKKVEYTNGHLSHTNLEKSLLYQCVQLENYRPLEALFNNILDDEQEAKDSIMLSLFDSLLVSTNTISFFKYFYENTFIKEEFFEHGVDPGFRIANYDEGFNLYLSNCKPNSSKEDLQSFIFGNCILLRHYFIRGKFDKALAVGKQLYLNQLISDSELEEIYLFPRMRYLSSKLLFLRMIKTKKTVVTECVLGLLKYAKSVYSSLDAFGRRIVFYTIAEVFIQAKVDYAYQEQLKLIFINEFTLFPEGLIEKPLHKIITYFEPNGLLMQRP